MCPTVYVCQLAALVAACQDIIRNPDTMCTLPYFRFIFALLSSSRSIQRTFCHTSVFVLVLSVCLSVCMCPCVAAVQEVSAIYYILLSLPTRRWVAILWECGVTSVVSARRRRLSESTCVCGSSFSGPCCVSSRCWTNTYSVTPCSHIPPSVCPCVCPLCACVFCMYVCVVSVCE